MKYSVVKQFSNGAIDNIFNFFFKWVDFGKILIEVFWAFAEIWQAFFAIFYNLIMYVYYLFLFILDRGAEDTSVPRLFTKRVSGRLSSIPTLDLSTASLPSAAASAVSSAAAAVTSPQTARNPKAKRGGKRSLLKQIGDFFVNIFSKAILGIKAAAASVANFFSDKIKPVKEEEHEIVPGSRRSLIEDYMEEYERGRK